MVHFAGSRQPAGPSPRALELLHEANLRIAEPEPERARAPGPAVPSPAAAEPAPAVGAPPDPVHPGSAQAPARAPIRPRRPKAAPVDSYALPAPGMTKQKARSNHFRLPVDVEKRLVELADLHGCSRTRVVCSAITAEWQRLQRRRARAARTDEK